MLAGGSDAAIIPSGIGGFIACKALSRRNEEPERASRPWDKGRDGFVRGEGAGARPATTSTSCVFTTSCSGPVLSPSVAQVFVLSTSSTSALVGPHRLEVWRLPS